MTTSQNTEKKKSGVFGKILAWLLIIVFLAVGGLVYYKYYFVFGEGVKSGYLNFAVKKGNLFKTYEGKLIQEGLRTQTGSGVSSNEFEFSVENDSIFRILELNSGKYFDLHYKEYHGVLPWRGNTRYIVDEVINMK
ncbi:hypothetical protein [Sphingobacterium corticibacterium]|uniref:6-phosphogluconate dehydrogenase n=1 Tax=Sphingobacterium corticibacterium TaxID=2484746 RepID=A0A4Q6XP74_9SPHI|nr:hypothetical protein [Sphingobacterium corticibacterium]RZF62013.1 hypothetical protein EWE74_04135 [Sphingobacterium corticibacterium]